MPNIIQEYENKVSTFINNLKVFISDLNELVKQAENNKNISNHKELYKLYNTMSESFKNNYSDIFSLEIERLLSDKYLPIASLNATRSNITTNAFSPEIHPQILYSHRKRPLSAIPPALKRDLAGIGRRYSGKRGRTKSSPLKKGSLKARAKPFEIIGSNNLNGVSDQFSGIRLSNANNNGHVNQSNLNNLLDGRPN